MTDLIALVLRFGILVALWIFVFLSLLAMNKAATPAAPVASAGGRPKALVIIDGPLAGNQMDITQLTEFTIGRSAASSVSIQDDFASGQHARLFRRGSDWFIDDLDSRNGTFVQGVRIDTPERLQAGFDIKIGRTTLRLVGS